MISLGRFESSDWTPRNTTEAALYTPGSQVRPSAAQRSVHSMLRIGRVA